MIAWNTQPALNVSFQTPVTDQYFRKWLNGSTGLALATKHWKFKLGIMETAYNSFKSLSFMLISVYYREACLFVRVFLIGGHKTGIKALKTGLVGCYLIGDIPLGINRRCITTLASKTILNLHVNKTLGLIKYYLVFLIIQTLHFLLAQQNHMWQFCILFSEAAERNEPKLMIFFNLNFI